MATSSGASDRHVSRGKGSHIKGFTKASKRWMAESHPLGEMGSADDIPF